MFAANMDLRCAVGVLDGDAVVRVVVLKVQVS
jgi:hypothetical protein